MPQIAKVAVSAANYAIDKPYDYLLPDGTDAAVGSRVLVPFGRGNRLTEGMILSLERKTPEKELKAVREVLEPEPVCSEREIRLALWMRQRYFCTFYDAIRTILPAGVWYRYRQFWKLADYAGEDALSEKEKPLYALLSWRRPFPTPRRCCGRWRRRDLSPPARRAAAAWATAW